LFLLEAAALLLALLVLSFEAFEVGFRLRGDAPRGRHNMSRILMMKKETTHSLDSMWGLSLAAMRSGL